MNTTILRHSLIFSSILFLGGLASGCATVVAPLSTSDRVLTDEHHGLLFGNMRFAWHEHDQSEGLDQPQGMRWTLEEEGRGTRFVISDIPTDGSFVVKLPAGAYHVKGISFDGRGTWRAMLPTTFQVQPRGCTSLGLWELQSEKRFSEWITGHVLEDLEPTQGQLQQALATRECPTSSAPLDSAMRSKLAFQNRYFGPHYGHVD